MRRHELEPVSLTFGFVFTGLGLLFLIGRADQALRLHWIWPLLLLVLGAGILLDIARTRPDQPPSPPDREPEAATAAELDPDPAAAGPEDNREPPI
jgi:hypothetical protein